MEEEEGLPACRLGIGEGECVAERGAGGGGFWRSRLGARNEVREGLARGVRRGREQLCWETGSR